MEDEFWDIDESGNWHTVYQEIRQQSCDLPCKYAKLPENKNRNRYRDVSPFDHSRISLQLGTNDYINASLITVEEAQRNYILTQGPLPSTCGHFWEMVWEQKTRGVVMLNRVVEKGSIKCAQYWPLKGERDALFTDTNFKLTLVSEDIKSYYTIRQLELENVSTQETREILHFHYTTWPDFGVPESPASFLNFLFKVRESGCLNSDQGPVVVHCSAGIGRSGTFCLVDTCLLLMALRKDPSSVRICDVLLEMRRYRMGLIQTPDQLRFSYLAVIEGAKYIKGDVSLQESWKELSNEEDDPPEFSPPPVPPPRDPLNGKVEPSFFPEERKPQPGNTRITGSSSDSTVRMRTAGVHCPVARDDPRIVPERARDPPLKAPGNSQEQSKEKEELKKQELPKRRPSVQGGWSPLLTNVCLCAALAVSAYACYRVYFH